MPASLLGIQNYHGYWGPQHGGQRTGGLSVPGVLPSIKPNSRATTHPGVSGEIFIKFISHRRWTFALHQICQNDYEVVVNNLIPLFIWTHTIISPCVVLVFRDLFIQCPGILFHRRTPGNSTKSALKSIR